MSNPPTTPPLPYRRPPNLLPYPYLSLDERDRRWRLVREAMEREEVDCVVVPVGGTDPGMLQAHARYLTHVGGAADRAAGVFPATGEPCAVVAGVEAWRQMQPWCSDLREPSDGFASAVLSRLQELDLPHRRVGLVGIGDPVQPGQGTASHSFIRHLMTELPSVQWVDFTWALDEIRSVKSPEEVAFIERSTHIADQAYDAAVGILRPGVPEAQVWGALVETLGSLGSELPLHVQWVDGDRRHPAASAPLGVAPTPGPSPNFGGGVWGEGRILLAEVEGAWGGYRARRCQPLSCGQPDALSVDLTALAIDLWNRGVQRIRPGRSVGALREEVRRLALRSRPRSAPLATATASISLNGCGLGLDPPSVNDEYARPEDLERIINPGWCFSFGVTVRAASCALGWADTVAVRTRGARRLGTAPQRILVARW